ncbi:armadillo-type protein [Lipomyces orientalis]|uniref:Armadillo-type protein n=1 Tax=Lipomyces orientalis TaxID=1233043 RepID=A0ACC3TJJ8_9ASCO
MESSVPSDELYPIAVLIDELKHDDVSLRLAAIERLSTIALALGPERTRSELIPFLEESLDDEDEVLTVLAEQLGNFVLYVGGNQYAHVLLPPLESFAGVEEPLVRDKAVESLNKIADEMTEVQVEEYYLPLVKNLTTADWFTSKVSVTGLYSSVYQKVGAESRAGLRQLFGQLVYDDAPMVRRAAATHLTGLVSHIDKDTVVTDVVPFFLYLAQDDQDSVRLLTVDVLIATAGVLGPDLVREHLLEQLKKLFADKSWRVRYMVADRFEQLAVTVAAGDEVVLKTHFVPAMVRLLKDSEAEVRTVIAKQVPGFCQLVDRESVLDEILPCIEDLVNDPSQHVRAALATKISGLAPILGKDLTIKYLLPMFLQMLKDEFPEVRLNIICKLEQVNNVIGIDLLSQSLLPAITQLAQDKQWRVRLAIIEYIPLLASQLGMEFFDTQLRDLCMTWLHDNVYSIRDAATENLKNLTKVFGVAWSKATIIPKVIEAGANPNYLYRMTACVAATTLAPVVTIDVIKDDLLPFLNNLVGDPIPNIRFSVARSYQTVQKLLLEKAAESEYDSDAMDASTPAPTEEDTKAKEERVAEVKEIIRNVIVPNLEKLKEDEDVDVRFFANKTLQAIG